MSVTSINTSVLVDIPVVIMNNWQDTVTEWIKNNLSLFSNNVVGHLLELVQVKYGKPFIYGFDMKLVVWAQILAKSFVLKIDDIIEGKLEISPDAKIVTFPYGRIWIRPPHDGLKTDGEIVKVKIAKIKYSNGSFSAIGAPE